jgi:hypothetical protein
MPVIHISCGANGTQDGVIASRLCGAIRCATPAAAKRAASSHRMMARVRGKP